MAGIARGRLQEERKLWRKDHPHVRRRPLPLNDTPPALGIHTRCPAPAARAGLCGQAEDARRRDPGHPLLGMRRACQDELSLGGRALPRHHVRAVRRVHTRRVPHPAGWEREARTARRHGARARAGNSRTSTRASRLSAGSPRRPTTSLSSTRTSTLREGFASRCSIPTRVHAAPRASRAPRALARLAPGRHTRAAAGAGV